MDAFSVLCRTEGIIPAIESAHALAGALPGRPGAGARRAVLLVNLSGRGDKDVDIAARWFGHLRRQPRSASAVSAVAAGVREGARPSSRAALVGYLPAGFPSVDGAIAAAIAMAEAGADIVEIGLPYSDPLMDGPVIQEAVHRALAGGVRVTDVLRTVEAVAAAGVPVLVMTYWNPVDHYGVAAFARDLAAAGGSGLITPDLTPEEAGPWLAAAADHDLDRVFLVAPSSSERADQADHRGLRRVRLRGLADGHHRRQGSRSASQAAGLVGRVREHTDPAGRGRARRPRPARRPPRWPGSPTASSWAPRSSSGCWPRTARTAGLAPVARAWPPSWPRACAAAPRPAPEISR